jgi:hypothetical protein
MMKTFLAIYLGGTTRSLRAEWDKLHEAERQARTASGINAWHDWMQRHASAIVAEGGPVGKTKRSSAAGIRDVKNAVTGYVVVRAETHEDAARMFENHPHFTIFPGQSIEIMECLPIPSEP